MMYGTTTMAAAPTTMIGGAYGGAYGGATIAAPAQYASYAAPMTTATASYVAQPVAQQQFAPSYVAAPQMMGQNLISAAAAPVAPPKLTQGIPTPEQIAAQKAQYAAALDKQLKDAIATVTKETAIEKDMAKFSADKNIAMYNNQVDERLAEAVATADEMAVITTLELKKALVERNLQLSAQASNLTMDYNMKKLMTECAQKQYAFDVQYAQAEGKLMQDYNKQAAIANVRY